MAKSDGSYEVGYGKPPKASRWPKGQSGNPNGRKRGKRGIKTDLAAAIDGEQSIGLNGKEIRGSRQELALLTLASRAAAGDIKAAALLIPLIVQTFGFEDRGAGKVALSPNDQAMLDAILQSKEHLHALSAGSPRSSETTEDAGAAERPLEIEE